MLAPAQKEINDNPSIVQLRQAQGEHPGYWDQHAGAEELHSGVGPAYELDVAPLPHLIQGKNVPLRVTIRSLNQSLVSRPSHLDARAYTVPTYPWAAKMALCFEEEGRLLRHWSESGNSTIINASSDDALVPSQLQTLTDSQVMRLSQRHVDSWHAFTSCVKTRQS